MVVMKQNMDEADYRVAVRRDQLRSILCSEVRAALRSPSGTRPACCLGPANLEADIDIFAALEPPTKNSCRFNYREGSLHALDNLLGPGWDIVSDSGHTKFVTELRVWLTQTFLLKAKCRVGRYTAPLEGPGYRDVLALHIEKAPDEQFVDVTEEEW